MTMVLREGDEREVRAMGYTPEQALTHCLVFSDEKWEHREDGKVIAAWGFRLRGFLTRTVDAWLLTSPEVSDHKVKFARKTKAWVEMMFKRGYAAIYVEVHEPYHDAVKWLRWLGFEQVDVRIVGSERFLIMRKDRG